MMTQMKERAVELIDRIRDEKMYFSMAGAGNRRRAV